MKNVFTFLEWLGESGLVEWFLTLNWCSIVGYTMLGAFILFLLITPLCLLVSAVWELRKKKEERCDQLVFVYTGTGMIMGLFTLICLGPMLLRLAFGLLLAVGTLLA
ncbi:hypothetical protein IH979_00630 [Patescibacteria group bacterium]|nr:hypothetical protein [Patescibacteria group bacterium]